MLTVHAFTNSVLSTPNRACAIIIWPVEDTGKNSVSPSTMAIIIVSNKLIYNKIIWSENEICVSVCICYNKNSSSAMPLCFAFCFCRDTKYQQSLS